MQLFRLTLLLLLANIGYAAWSQGLLADYGWGTRTQAEPQRMQQQIRPQALQIVALADRAAPPASSSAQTLPPSSAALLPETPEPVAAPLAAASAASLLTPVAPRSTQCLQAGLFSATQVELLRQRLPALLPRGSWAWHAGIEPPRWIVYMGKYPNEEALAKKRAELRQLNVFYEALINPTLEPGLSLGHFSLRADAEAAMARASTRGVRTARVLLEQAAVQGQWLRLGAVDEALRARLDALKPRLLGKTLKPCL